MLPQPQSKGSRMRTFGTESTGVAEVCKEWAVLAVRNTAVAQCVCLFVCLFVASVSAKCIDWWIFVMETQCVFCCVRNEFP